MHHAKQNVLTPCGVARLLARGILACFAPEHQQAELRRMAEYMQDLAYYRESDAELATRPCASLQATRDAVWFDALAVELESASVESTRS